MQMDEFESGANAPNPAVDVTRKPWSAPRVIESVEIRGAQKTTYNPPGDTHVTSPSTNRAGS